MARAVGGGENDAVWSQRVACSARPERARIGAIADRATAGLADQFSERRGGAG